MFLHVYFPPLVSSLIKIYYWGSEDNIVEHFEHCENPCREGQSFLMTFTRVWQHFVFTVMAVRVITSMGRLLLLYSTKTAHYVCCPPPQSWNDDSGSIVGQDQKILNDWCSKRTLRGALYPVLFMWASFHTRSTERWENDTYGNDG
jgi:hypothetical protein